MVVLKKLSSLSLLITTLAYSFVFVSNIYAASISSAYATKGDIPNGSIVSLVAPNDNTVEATNTSNEALVLGVTIPATDASVAVNPSSTTTQVALSGTVPTLVTTTNGNISKGDKIGVSNLDGIGSKTVSGAPVIGIAQSDLTAASPGVQQVSVKNVRGQTMRVTVGYVNVQLHIDGNTATSTSQLNGLQRPVYNLTGRVVSTLRIVLSVVVLFLGVVVLVTIIYASIKGGVIAMGRNPLAKFSILRSLERVLIMSVIIAGLAGATIVMLLS